MIVPKKCKDDPMECELELVKNAVDKYQAKVGKRIVNSPEIIEIVQILETFLRSKRLICYGGIALNNILPKSDQFYDKDIELPDYDFYSVTPKEDAVELADIYYSKGYRDIEAKSGVHAGTYKVYVNFMPIADITLLPKELFDNIYKTSIVVDRIHYVNANFLRMNIYAELRNPDGDVSRFEKIYKRLMLLNKNYPITINTHKCSRIEYKRTMVNRSKVNIIYNTLLHVFLQNELVFFGGHALSIYAKFIRSKYIRNQFKLNEPDFDVFSNNPMSIIDILQEKFKHLHIPFRFKKHEAIGEILDTNYELIVYNDTVGFIYTPRGCYSYNTIQLKGQQINIASIDTMLFMYFTFYHINKPYYNPDRILCMTQLLYKVQVENKYSQHGVLTRFPLKCYGFQPQIEDIKAEKAKIYDRLKNDKNSEEYQLYFFKYIPNKNNITNTSYNNNNNNNNNQINNPYIKHTPQNKSPEYKEIIQPTQIVPSHSYKKNRFKFHKKTFKSHVNNSNVNNYQVNNSQYNKTRKYKGIFGLYNPK